MKRFILFALLACSISVIAQQTAVHYEQSTALEASHSSPGVFFGAAAYNSSGSTVFLLVFDSDSTPTNGVAPTLPPVPILTGQTGSISFSPGLTSKHKTWYAFVSTTDTTLTSAGSVGWFVLQIW